MLVTLNYLGKLLSRILWLIKLVLLLSLVVAVMELLQPKAASEQDLLPEAILAFLWSINSWILASGFQALPTDSPNNGWWQRKKVAFGRFIYHLLGIIFVATTVVSIWMTIRLLGAIS